MKNIIMFFAAVIILSSCNKKNEEKISDGNGVPVIMTVERLKPPTDSKIYFVKWKNTPVYDFKHKLTGYADEGIYSGIERNDSIYCTETYRITFSQKIENKTMFLSYVDVKVISIFFKDDLTEWHSK